MNNKTVIFAAALLGLALTTAPLASASDDASSMSNVQHRKHMAGPKHPENKEVESGEKETPHMSNVQHRKHMGGMKHKSDESSNQE